MHEGNARNVARDDRKGVGRAMALSIDSITAQAQYAYVRSNCVENGTRRRRCGSHRSLPVDWTDASGLTPDFRCLEPWFSTARALRTTKAITGFYHSRRESIPASISFH